MPSGQWSKCLEIFRSTEYKDLSRDTDDGYNSTSDHANSWHTALANSILSHDNRHQFVYTHLSCSSDTYLVLATLGLLLTTIFYDELGLAGHHIGKNLCNIGGYTTLELGATKVMGTCRYLMQPRNCQLSVHHCLVGLTRDLDSVSIFAIYLSGALIFTTIQAQDFADVEGDSALGRVTFPIYAPELSRVFTLFALVGWSCGLSAFWDIGPLHRAIFIGFGALVGWRYYVLRTAKEDGRSYVLYNVSIWRSLGTMCELISA